jgi:hypothetical protein
VKVVVLITRQILLFIGLSIGIYLLITYYLVFDSLIAIVVSIDILIGVVFYYVRKRQLNALKSAGFINDAEIGGVGGRVSQKNENKDNDKNGDNDDRIIIKYFCLCCGAQVKDSKCEKCGSRMKKPIF